MDETGRVAALEAQCMELSTKMDALLREVLEQSRVIDEMLTLLVDLSGTNASGVAVLRYRD
jgi:hypothetical protein